MARFALVNDQAVSNLIEIEVGEDIEWPAGTLCLAVPDDLPVAIGWSYDGSAFVEPPAPPPPLVAVPPTISQRQAHLELLDAGLLDVAEQRIMDIADPLERRRAQIEWGSQTYDRASPFLRAFAAELGLSSTDLDELFVRAAAR